MKRLCVLLGALMIAGAGASAAAQTTGSGTVVMSSSGSTSYLHVPRGYTPVWEDDRLNPNRARGTAAGEAAMNRIWTEEVPRTLRVRPPDPEARGRNAVVLREARGVYVQVAVFGTRVDARTAAHDLSRDGIPAVPATLRAEAGPTPIVLAGPYPDRASAQAGLADLRGAGYGRAFIRN